MKHTVRLLALLLCGILLLGLCACGKKDPQTPDTTEGGSVTDAPNSEETTQGEEKPSVPSDLKFDNAEFRILARNESDYYNTELYMKAEDAKSEVDNAVYSRYKFIEETLGVTFKMETTTESGINNWMNVKSTVSGKDDTYHLIAQHGRTSVNYAINGLVGDWTQLTYTDLGASWWSQDALKQWRTPAGSVYMMDGDMSYLSVGQAVGMFFNKTVLDSSGLEYPYQLVDDGEWTYENFESYVKQLNRDLDGDNTGNIKTDKTGYATHVWRGPMNVVYSTGARWLTVGEDEITVVGKNDHNLTDAFDDYFSFLASDAIVVDNYGDAQAAFVANRVAFYDEITLRAADIKRETRDFGLVPMPKYKTDVDKNYTFVNAATNVFTIPKVVFNNAESKDMTSAVLEYLGYYGQKDVLPTYYNEMLTYGSMSDSKSIRMMGIIRDSVTFDLGYYLVNTSSKVGQFCDIGNTIANSIMNGQGTDREFTTLYDQRVSTLTSVLRDWNNLQ
ncbi:MAG TPA: hypothetical protein DDW30_09570 [Clostridiales bacterium]|nr:hypothetical protein [Clostridiales bacterium]